MKTKKHKKHNNTTNNEDIGMGSMWLLVIGIVLIPIILNGILFLNTPPTPTDLGNKEWLGFWGSFIGGGIGGLATLIAIVYTLKNNLRNHNEQIKFQLELKSLEVKPYINFRGKSKEKINGNLFNPDQAVTKRYEKLFETPSGYIIFNENGCLYTTKLGSPYKETLEQAGVILKTHEKGLIVSDSGMIEQPIFIENIGSGPSLNVIVDLYSQDSQIISKMIVPPFNLAKGEEINWRLVFTNKFEEGKYFFLFRYMNVHGISFYSQKLKFEYKRNFFGYENILLPISTDPFLDELTHDVS